MLSSNRRTFVSQTCMFAFLLVLTILGDGQVGVKPDSKQSGAATPRSSIEKRIRAIVVKQLGVDQKKYSAKARFVEDLGADSLDMVELIMSFEEAFDIEIPDKDAEKIHTAQDAVDYVSKHVTVRK